MTALLLLLSLLAPADTQPRPAVISGRVIHLVAGDSLPAAGARIILHRVTPDRQGPIDSLLGTATGGFRFQVTPDSGEIYLVSARWGGVEYFGPPMTAALLAEDRDIVVMVSDTSSTAPVVVTARQLVIAAATPDGNRAVIDAITLANPGALTRVMAPGAAWSWRYLVPPGAIEPRLYDSDFARDAFALVGDTLQLQAAIPPGKHSVLVAYQLPPHIRRFDFPLFEPAELVTVMSEEPGLEPTGFRRGDTRELEGKQFTEWNGGAPAGETTMVTLPWDGTAPSWLLPGLIAGLGCTLVVAWVLAMRREKSAPAWTSMAPAAPPMPSEASRLLDRLAALDQSHGEGSKRQGPEWEAYLTERAALKDALRLALRPPAE